MARKQAEAMKALEDVAATARSEAFQRAEVARRAAQSAEAQAFMQAHDLKDSTDCRGYIRKIIRDEHFMNPDPLTHWRRVLANPAAPLIAHELASEAIRKLEARSGTAKADEDLR